MSAEIQDVKAALRRQVVARLKEITPQDRAAASAQARALLEAQPCWKKTRSILFFAPTLDELDLWPMLGAAIAAGKLVALPRFQPETNRYGASRIRTLVEDIAIGRFGIREPIERCASVELNLLDLIFVPGVAFDLQGRRLGRGKGFYDQMLRGLRGVTCGVAFDQQVVRTIPVAPHDVSVNCILTPSRWIEPPTRAVLE